MNLEVVDLDKQFNYILESQVVVFSKESFMHTSYLHLFTEMFMKIYLRFFNYQKKHRSDKPYNQAGFFFLNVVNLLFAHIYLKNLPSHFVPSQPVLQLSKVH